MAYLKPKTVIKTVHGERIIIENLIDEGGQGHVYKVSYNEKFHALKWYSRGVTWCDPDVFYSNLKANVLNGSPASTFLWPIAITEIYNGCFGYVMDLRPKEYKKFEDFLLNEDEEIKHFTFRSTVNAAMQMIASFRRLHNKGLAYIDLNDGNIFINPRTGDILLCDNDNVGPNGKDLGMRGKSRYMAPEVMANRVPDMYSDRFSLATVLFMLLFIDHPLFGNRNNNRINPEKNEYKLYCENPVFIFDPTDESNRPIPGVVNNAGIFWPCYPKHIRELFIKAFNKNLMLNNDPSNERLQRVMEQEWLAEFAKLRNEIILCPNCGKETFINNFETKYCTCTECKKRFSMMPVLETKKYSIPLQPNQLLYSYEIEPSTEIDIHSVTSVVGRVVENKNKPGIYGIRNESGKLWTKHTPGGYNVAYEPNKVIPIERGIKIEFGSSSSTGTIK